MLGGKEMRQIHFLLLLSFIFVFLTGSGCVQSFEEENQYQIKEMDIASESVKSSFVELNVTTYVEKYRGESKENTSLLLKAYNMDTGLLEMQAERALGPLEKGETRIESQLIEVPREGDYEIRAILFENGTQKSSGRIDVRNLEGLPVDVIGIGIEIPEMDFIVRKVSDGSVVIESDIYLTNEGRDTSSDFRMLVKARELDAGLLADKVWATTGRIRPETTIIRNVNITVPDKYNYAVEVLIWNNDTIVKRGEDYILLVPEKVVEKGTVSETREVDSSKFERTYEEIPEEEAYEEEATPGFGIVAAALSGLFALAIFRRKQR
jgi:hypothetical protein